MGVILDRLWNEPAAAAGVFVAAGLALGELFLGDGLQSSDLPAIAAPIAVSGLTRPFVRSTRT